MDRRRILILNGVNLGELGTREVNIYGNTDFREYFAKLQSQFPEFELAYFQTDLIGEMVRAMLDFKDGEAIVINPGAYTHTSIVLADTIKALPVKVIEVHISNLFGREKYRRNSFISGVCYGSISGFGLKGYELALRSLC